MQQQASRALAGVAHIRVRIGVEKEQGVGCLNQPLRDNCVQVHGRDNGHVPDDLPNAGRDATLGIDFGFAGHGPVQRQTDRINWGLGLDSSQQFADETLHIGTSDQAASGIAPSPVRGDQFDVGTGLENVDIAGQRGIRRAGGFYEVWPPMDREVVVIGKLGIKAADFVVEFGQKNAFHKEPSLNGLQGHKAGVKLSKTKSSRQNV